MHLPSTSPSKELSRQKAEQGFQQMLQHTDLVDSTLRVITAKCHMQQSALQWAETSLKFFSPVLQCMPLIDLPLPIHTSGDQLCIYCISAAAGTLCT